MVNKAIVIGGGLAGSEAAWQLATRGINVQMYEMRPGVMTGAHTGPYLGELVCSNSLGSNLPDRASGLLKEELRKMGSLLMECADENAVPAGSALAVDREEFAKKITHRIETNPRIEIIRQEVTEISEEPTIIASGPLTSASLAEHIASISGSEHLYFYDAIAPVVVADTIDMKIAFKASRYGRGEQENGDYINCPLSAESYDRFIKELLNAERIELRSFEIEIEQGVRAGMHRYFEGCLPIEILAERGHDALAYGPMRPVGLRDPRTGTRPYAVLQLRQDNLAASLYNMVGFQTNLTFKEQRRVLRMIPGLEKAEFTRYGQMHRNTFIYSPRLLRPTLQFYDRDDLFFAGQITGVEGYVGNIGTGLLAGWNLSRVLQGQEPFVLPATSMLGALCQYITHAAEADFQPTKANFGILPPLDRHKGGRRNKRLRATAYANRALQELDDYLRRNT